MRTFSCFALLLAFVPFAHAGVLTVGGPGAAFTDLQPAVDAALDGDVILVRANVTSVMVTGKSLSIVADQASNLTLNGNAAITGVPAGGLVLMAGFDLSANPNTLVQVINCIGAVRLQDMSMTTMNYLGSVGQYPLEIQNSSDVAVTNCQMRGADGISFGPGSQTGGAFGAYVRNSTVSFHGCTLRGGRGANGGFSSMLVPLSGTQGADGLFAAGTSSVFLSGCTLIGGDGGTGMDGGGLPPMCAPTAYDYPTAGGWGGSGVRLFMPAVGNGFANNAAGGMGGMSGVNLCGSQPVQSPNGGAFQSDGQPFNETTGVARVLNAPRLVRESTSFVLHFAGVPGDHVYLASSQQAAHLPALQFDGVFLGQGPYRRTSMGMIGSTGSLDVTLPLGDLGPGVAEDLRHLQCVMLDASGHLHVGGSAVLTRLDSAY